MGLFSNILGSKVTELNEKEAFVGLLVSLASSDGDFSNEEIQDVVSILSKTKLLKGSNTVMIIKKVFKIIENQGLNELLELSKNAISDSNKLSAFAVCVDLAYSDGTIDSNEEAVLENIIDHFHLEESETREIIRVITLKNNI